VLEAIQSCFETAVNAALQNGLLKMGIQIQFEKKCHVSVG
jgi:hypothetical protein